MDSEVFENIEESLKNSWEVHRQAFGPILEPAFKENKEVRLKLLAALNLISRREVKRGYEILLSLKEHCLYGEDKAARYFFMGLCFEMMGSKKEMAKWYEKCNNYPHNFYYPHLKLAKYYHGEAYFLKAEGCYKASLECVLNIEDEYKDKTVTGSLYLNLASCFTMMHRYKEAAVSFREALRYPIIRGTAATGAILYAAMGNENEVKRFLGILKSELPSIYDATFNMTEKILKRQHPHFNPMPVDKALFSEFWRWFLSELGHNKELIFSQEWQKLLKTKLKELFPFLEREARVKVLWEEKGKVIIEFSDFYALALNIAYKELINSCPNEIKQSCSFEIVR